MTQKQHDQFDAEKPWDPPEPYRGSEMYLGSTRHIATAKAESERPATKATGQVQGQLDQMVKMAEHLRVALRVLEKRLEFYLAPGVEREEPDEADHSPLPPLAEVLLEINRSTKRSMERLEWIISRLAE